jgi:molecular chaperone GrpE
MPDGEDTMTDEVATADAADAAVEQAAEAVEQDIAAIAAERDEFKALAQRIQADFENYKKRILKQQTEHLERAAEQLVAKLLPALDTADLAVAHGGGEAVEQVWITLTDALGREGLERIDPKDEAFDPTRHEAVMHEPGDAAADAEPTVTEVMRAGYAWKGRVLRPAMVKVTG